jgi:hypothetical protein
MGVATSMSGLVQGPWVQQESPPWACNGGHGMIFTDGQGDSRLVFHWPNDTPNERVKHVPVSITAHGIELRGDISHEDRLRRPGGRTEMLRQPRALPGASQGAVRNQSEADRW